jgi:hypothetical protein
MAYGVSRAEIWRQAQTDRHQLANSDVNPDSVHTEPEGLDRPGKIGLPICPDDYPLL